MLKSKKNRIVILILLVILALFIGYKIMEKYKQDNRYNEWANSDIGKAILYAVEGTSYHNIHGSIASPCGILVYSLDGSGNCIKVVNQFNEYLRLHPDIEDFKNRKIEVSFFSDCEPNLMYFTFSNYLDGDDEVHEEIDVAHVSLDSIINGHINTTWTIVPNDQPNDILYMVYDVYLKDNRRLVEECSNLFPNLKKVVIVKYNNDSEEYVKLSEEIHEYLPDCDIEVLTH